MDLAVKLDHEHRKRYSSYNKIIKTLKHVLGIERINSCFI